MFEARALAWEFHTSRSCNLWSKLNCDAPFKNPRDFVGVAGIFRDKIGTWKLGYGKKKCRARSILMGEIKVILLGLKQIDERGWRNIVLCLDSMQVVHAILKGSSVRDVNFMLINTCRDLLIKMIVELGDTIGA